MCHATCPGHLCAARDRRGTARSVSTQDCNLRHCQRNWQVLAKASGSTNTLGFAPRTNRWHALSRVPRQIWRNVDAVSSVDSASHCMHAGAAEHRDACVCLAERTKLQTRISEIVKGPRLGNSSFTRQLRASLTMRS